MKKEHIESLIKRLEVEITQTEDSVRKSVSLERVKEMAKAYRGEDMVVSFEQIGEKIRNQKEELRIMTGWTKLDDILKGFRLQQLVVVSALTKSGKTSFLMDLTTRIKSHNPLWFPFEESAEELIRKYIERDEQPPHGFTPENIKGSTLEWIESKIVESIAKNDTRVVFIDQLDFIVPFGSDNHALRVGQAMRELKALAKRWNVVIFIICHLVKTKMDTQPTMEDLKGSSSIGQEADTVIMLWREMRRDRGQVVITNNTNVSVQANRRTGSTGNVKMVYEKGKYTEYEWGRSEDEIKADEDFENFN